VLAKQWSEGRSGAVMEIPEDSMEEQEDREIREERPTTPSPGGG
jgi:hypothetical protein